MPSSGVLVLPDGDEPGGAEAGGEGGVVGLGPAALLEERHALVERIAGRVRGQVLEHEGHAAERAVGKVAGRRRAGPLEQRRDHRVELAG